MGFADYFLQGMNQGAGMWSEDQSLARQSRMDALALEDRARAEEQRQFQNANVTADNARADGRYQMERTAFDLAQKRDAEAQAMKKTRVGFYAQQLRAMLGPGTSAPGMQPAAPGQDPLMQGPGLPQAPEQPPQQGPGLPQAPDMDAMQLEAMIQHAEAGNDEEGLKALVGLVGSPFARYENMRRLRQLKDVTGDNFNVIANPQYREGVRILYEMGNPDAATQLFVKAQMEQAQQVASEQAALAVALKIGLDPDVAKAIGPDAVTRLAIEQFKNPGDSLAQREAMVQSLMTLAGMSREMAEAAVFARGAKLIGELPGSAMIGANKDESERLKFRVERAKEQLTALNKGKMPPEPTSEQLNEMDADDPKRKAWLDYRSAMLAYDKHLKGGERPQTTPTSAPTAGTPTYNTVGQPAAQTQPKAPAGPTPPAGGTTPSAAPEAPQSVNGLTPVFTLQPEVSDLTQYLDNPNLSDEQIADIILKQQQGGEEPKNVTGTNPGSAPSADPQRPNRK